MKTVAILFSVITFLLGNHDDGRVHYRGATLAEVDAAAAKLEKLIKAIETVESNGRDDATGDGGRAAGRYQIWRAYWQDAVEHCPEIGGSYEDVRDRAYGRRVVVAYLLRYCPSAVAEADLERCARVHNGGPRGHKRRATLPYWRKVEAVLQ